MHDGSAPHETPRGEADDDRPLAIADARRLQRERGGAATEAPDRLTQRTLVIAATHGDEAAFAGLVAAWTGRLVAIAYRIEHDWQLANDVAQDALVAAWRDLRGLRDPDRFDAWLQRILVRLLQRAAIDQRRRRTAPITLVTPPTSPDPASAIADRDQLDRAFGRLTLEQRTVLVLRHYQGRTLPEISAVLGIPEGTVASRLHYATSALRASLDADSRPGTRP